MDIFKNSFYLRSLIILELCFQMLQFNICLMMNFYFYPTTFEFLFLSNFWIFISTR